MKFNKQIQKNNVHRQASNKPVKFATRLQKRSIGVNFNGQGADVWLWAANSERVEIVINDEQKIALIKQAYGYWHIFTTMLQPGDRYEFILDEKKILPDPASLSQPNGVHKASEAIDLNDFKWSDGKWINPELESYIFYELHTGTFTPGGTFKEIGERLDHLKALGITAIELMPVASFPGNRNWGYDGVFPFAVQQSYGGAKELQKLVDLCHQKEMAVVLDVVYNHFGPEGNCLGDYGPYFTDKYKTPWGGAVNFDDAGCDGVRCYFIENVLMWFRDFHFDALRLDAVHAIRDFSPKHILREIRERTEELAKQTGKQYYLIVECDLNDTRFINQPGEQGYGMHSQWSDEFHHALRVAAGQERKGYYADFNGVADLVKAYKCAYVYNGQYSSSRQKTFGTDASLNPAEQFIVFSQNHDQVGNRMLGERSSALVSFSMQKLMAGAVMLGPYLPLLFMGEEWAEPNPFQYFVSHSDPKLAEAVRKGRSEEFKSFHQKREVPDPVSEKTFKRSKVQWQLLTKEPHATMLSFYKALIKIRKDYLPLHLFTRKQLEASYNCLSQGVRLHRWHNNRHIYIFMNFSKQQQTIALPAAGETWYKLLYSADYQWKGPIIGAETIHGGVPFFIEPESIAVYSNHV